MESFLKNNNGFVLEVLKNKEQKSSKSKVCFFDLEAQVIYEIDLYDHTKELRKKFKWVEQELSEFEEMISNEEQDFADSIPEGEHPGWHTFECWSYSAKLDKNREIFKKLAKENRWYRVGFYKSKMDLNPHRRSELNESDLVFLETFAKNLEFKIEFEKE